MELSAQENL